MAKVRIACLLLVAIPVISSCQVLHAGNTQPFPGAQLAAGNVNSQIVLLDSPELLNSHRNGDVLSLVLMNLSNQDVVFADNFGVRVTRPASVGGNDIQNSFYNAGAPFVLPPKRDYPLGQQLSVIPFIPDLTQPDQVRVAVLGHMDSMEGQEVAAYIDITILP